MWRHRFLIKGSEQELAWLNAQAQRHYLLMTIHGNWYQFKKVPTIYRVFSEYVPQAIAADMSNSNSAFQVLAQVQVQQMFRLCIPAVTNQHYSKRQWRQLILRFVCK